MYKESPVNPFFPNDAAKSLLEFAKEQYEKRGQNVPFIKNNDEANELLNPFGKYPHAFVLACIMDRQIAAENAWKIPFWIKETIHGFDIKDLLPLSKDEIQKIFLGFPKQHRFPVRMAECFFKAVHTIQNKYNGDARKIWNDNPPSGLLVSRFLDFEGVGVKIASMATNILVRQFRISVKDRHCIDISPDTHTVRVFQRLNLTQGDSIKKTIYMARVINPEYPGILDYPCWKVGQDFCKAKKQQCINEKGTCPFFSFCPSRTEN